MGTSAKTMAKTMRAMRRELMLVAPWHALLAWHALHSWHARPRASGGGLRSCPPSRCFAPALLLYFAAPPTRRSRPSRVAREKEKEKDPRCGIGAMGRSVERSKGGDESRRLSSGDMSATERTVAPIPSRGHE